MGRRFRPPDRQMGTLTALKDPKQAGPFDDYEHGAHYCELNGKGQQPSRSLIGIWHRLQTLDVATLRRRRYLKATKHSKFEMGIVAAGHRR